MQHGGGCSRGVGLGRISAARMWARRGRGGEAAGQGRPGPGGEARRRRRRRRWPWQARCTRVAGGHLMGGMWRTRWRLKKNWPNFTGEGELPWLAQGRASCVARTGIREVNPDDLVFGGWDISSMNLADAMTRAKVLDIDLQKQLRPYMDIPALGRKKKYPEFGSSRRRKGWTRLWCCGRQTLKCTATSLLGLMTQRRTSWPLWRTRQRYLHQPCILSLESWRVCRSSTGALKTPLCLGWSILLLRTTV